MNGEYRHSDPIGKLMHDFHCRTGDDMFYSPIAERVDYFKETEGGNEQMCRAVEDLTKKYEQRGEHEHAVNVAIMMIADGVFAVETIARYSGLTVEEIMKLKEQYEG